MKNQHKSSANTVKNRDHDYFTREDLLDLTMRPELSMPLPLVSSHNPCDIWGVKRLIIALLVISFAVIAQPIQASPQSPTVFVETIFDELTGEFRALSSAPSTNQVEALFKEKLSPHIDFQGLARWILREHWEHSENIQRQAFLVALQKHLIKTYAAALSFDDSVNLTVSEQVKSGKRLTQVTGTLTSNESNSTKVLFRLVEAKSTWQIFDVGVHGISVAKTIRADISAIAGQGGIDAVTAALSSGNFKLLSQR